MKMLRLILPLFLLFGGAAFAQQGGGVVGIPPFKGCATWSSTNILTGTGSACGGSGSSGITIGTTTITSGTSGRVLYDSAGVVGELATTGSGSVVLATSPTLVTPTLGVATGTSLALSGGLVVGTTTIGSPISNALYLGSATPTSANYSALTSGGVLYLNAPTLNSPIVFSSADASGNAAYYHGSRFVVGSGIVNGFSSTTTYSGSIDSAFSRISAGIIGVGTGAAGSIAGGLQLTNLLGSSGVLQLGAADASSAVAQTLQVQSVVAGTSNAAGADFTFNGSRGTGSASGGKYIVKLGYAGSTGSTQNTLGNALQLNTAAAAAGGLLVHADAGLNYVALSQNGGTPANNHIALYDSTGTAFYNSGNYVGTFSSGQLSLKNNAFLGFSGGSAFNSASDTMLTRIAAGILKISSSGTTGGVIRFDPVTVANLPAAATAGAGARGFVTDALMPVYGSTVTGGGAVKVPVYSDGTNWIVG